jgi:hypothetical protein
VLHLAAESNSLRAAVFRSAAEEVCRSPVPAVPMAAKNLREIPSWFAPKRADQLGISRKFLQKTAVRVYEKEANLVQLRLSAPFTWVRANISDVAGLRTSVSKYCHAVSYLNGYRESADTLRTRYDAVALVAQLAISRVGVLFEWSLLEVNNGWEGSRCTIKTNESDADSLFSKSWSHFWDRQQRQCQCYCSFPNIEEHVCLQSDILPHCRSARCERYFVSPAALEEACSLLSVHANYVATSLLLARKLKHAILPDATMNDPLDPCFCDSVSHSETCPSCAAGSLRSAIVERFWGDLPELLKLAAELSYELLHLASDSEEHVLLHAGFKDESLGLLKNVCEFCLGLLLKVVHPKQKSMVKQMNEDFHNFMYMRAFSPLNNY